MCYWFAGSTYDILEHLYGGKNTDTEHAGMAGRLGPIKAFAGYSKLWGGKEGDIDDAVDAALEIEHANAKKKQPEITADMRKEAEEELRKLPKLDDILKKIEERRPQVMEAIEKVRVDAQNVSARLMPTMCSPSEKDRPGRKPKSSWRRREPSGLLSKSR